MPPEPTVKAVAAQLSTLRGQVDVLTGIVAELTDEGTGLKAPAPNWVGLTPAEHAKKLAALAEWVDTVLTVQYLDAPLRDCWPNHQPVINYLSTLRAEWFAIFNRKYPDRAAALVFLDRYLPGYEARVRRSLDNCQSVCALATGPVPIRRPARPYPA